MIREDRVFQLLHRLADQMEKKLRTVFASAVLSEMDCDDIRGEYDRWVEKRDNLTNRYDRLNALLD